MGRDKDGFEKNLGATGKMEKVVLLNDHGDNLSFRGYQYAQTSFYEEGRGVLTKQELYATEDGHEAFSIVSSDGNLKSRRAYLVRRDKQMCRISDGEKELTVPLDWLIRFAQTLRQIDEEKVSGENKEKTDPHLWSVNE